MHLPNLDTYSWHGGVHSVQRCSTVEIYLLPSHALNFIEAVKLLPGYGLLLSDIMFGVFVQCLEHTLSIELR